MDEGGRSRLAAVCVAALCIAAAAWGAAGPSTETPPRVRGEMLVTTDWLARNLHNPNLVVLHVARKRDGYDAGHLPGARFLAWSDLVTTRAGVPNELPSVVALTALVRRLGIEEQSRIILYDENAGLEAARAYVTFDYLGLGDRTALLDGLLKKWRAEGRPTTTTIPAVKPSMYTPRVRPEIIVPLGTMQRLVKAKTEGGATTVTLIDGRPEKQYTGAEAGEAIKNPGHIPGAENVCWVGNVVSEQDPALRSPQELRELYAKAGVKPGQEVVTYCRTGVMASHNYFTAKYLGYNARLYDGSYIEWSTAKDTRITTGTQAK